MFVNLLQNAYKYSKENGHIDVSLKETGTGIILTVADDGIGIEPEELPKIWNRFYRVDKSRRFVRGTGLGLAMVQQIVKVCGGAAGSAAGAVKTGTDRSSYISTEEAKNIALKHAGVTGSEAAWVTARLERDDGRTVYDIEFRLGSQEYDYELDAYTGEILACDFEIEIEINAAGGSIVEYDVESRYTGRR